MAPETKALVAFTAWFDAQIASGKTRREVAEALSVEPPSIWQWVTRRARPVAEVRERIFLIAGVPVLDWETPEEAAERELQLQRARDFGHQSAKAG